MSKKLFTDGNWSLQQSDSDNLWAFHWLKHECTPGLLTYRYSHSLGVPCLSCGQTAPKELQGLFNMMELL